MRNVLYVLAFVGLLFPLCAFSQNLNEEPLVPRPNNYSLGFGAGIATMYGDLNTTVPKLGWRIGLGRHITNSFMIGIEFYSGYLASSEAANDWTTGIKSMSRFYSIDFNAKVNMSVFFNNSESTLSRFLGRFYIGSGIGYINNSISSITDTLKTTKPNDTSLKKAIKRHDEQPYIPLNIGVRFPLKNFLGTKNTLIMLNYNMCYTFSDYIDGYNLSLIGKNNTSNRFNDVYSVLTVGFSFSLGRNKDSFHWMKKNEAKKE